MSGNPECVETVLNLGKGSQRAPASESEHEGQREEAAGPSQLATTQRKQGHRLVLDYTQHGPRDSSCKKRKRSR